MARWTSWIRWLYGLGIRRRVSADPKHRQADVFFQAAQLRAWSHALTLRLATIESDKETSFSTGSGVLIEFANHRAVVGTAWHVLEEFRRRRDDGKAVVVVCDNMPIATPRLVFADPARDIGFIEVPAMGRSGLKAVPYRPKLLWPPPRVTKGDDVILCGFPKLLRVDGDEILHGDLNLMLPVESASETMFYLQINWDNLIQAGAVTLPPETTDFGGASGGPVFLVDAEANPLIGLISQAGENLPLWRIAPLSDLPDDLDTRATEPL
jgi:hypothetical protein